MISQLRTHAEQIMRSAIAAVLPHDAVRRALENARFPGRVYLVGAGKAAWAMARTAADCLGSALTEGIVITKYGHVAAPIPGITCLEAGHPVPDENSFAATARALSMTENLTAQDTVLFLLSGGGSALFEDPLVSGEELQDITRQLLASGADITQVNTIRKRLSRVKGGRFAQHCAPAHVYAVILSDVVSQQPDMIASGPACADTATCADALAIAAQYHLQLTPEALALLGQETPKRVTNVTTCISGSVRELVAAAAKACEELGYRPVILTDALTCQAKDAGKMLAELVLQHRSPARPLAFLAGGETVVKLTGTGKGGRNQELALSAAAAIEAQNACVFSFGSDGTDGPTDAAGGYVDGHTARTLRSLGIDPAAELANNNAYCALAAANGLLITGPTGTNVCDVSIALLP